MNRQFQLTILGSNSAVPAFGRFPTSQVLNVNKHLFLIDCGEGTQIRIAQNRVKRNSITHIFISHLHGDHVYGLPGLLTSMSLNSRQKPLDIYGPPGIKKYLDTVFEISGAFMTYEITVHELEFEDQTRILEFHDLDVYCFPVLHRVPCYGYKFVEKITELKIDKEAIDKYGMSIPEIQSAKKGGDLERGGEVIPNAEISLQKADPVSYAFCADSRADESLLKYLKGLTAMYFETTYLKDMETQALERAHSTTELTAGLAKSAGVDLLIVGHYSSRYKNIEIFGEEIAEIFPNHILAMDNMVIDLLDSRK